MPNRTTSNTASPMSHRPYTRDLRQRNSTKRAIPWPFKIAINQTNGTVQVEPEATKPAEGAPVSTARPSLAPETSVMRTEAASTFCHVSSHENVASVFAAANSTSRASGQRMGLRVRWCDNKFVQTRNHCARNKPKRMR